MTPPKLLNPLQYAIILARVLPDWYPLPPPGAAGIPRMIFTLGLRDTVFAQLSHVAILKLFCVLEPMVKEGRPQ